MTKGKVTKGSSSSDDSQWDASETWPNDRIERYQLRRLRTVVGYAASRLPFYQQRFKQAGFDPSQLKRLEDFAKVPTFAKNDVLERLHKSGSFPVGMEQEQEDLEKGAHAALSMTSGTMGEAFFYTSRNWVRRRGLGQMRVMWWSGWRPGMRVMVLAPGWHSLSFVQNWAFARMGADIVIPWGTFLPTFADRCVDALLEHRPQFLYLFVPMLYAMLGECERRRLNPRQAFRSVRSILVVGEPMTPKARERLRELLGVGDIFEGAGSPEGLEGLECSFHTGHHLNIKNCYVEVLDMETGTRPVPPGERGRLVLTSLADLTASLYIRVDLQDVAAFLPEQCPCGKTWPMIEVYGRLSDMVAIGDKRFLHYDVRRALDEIPAMVGRPFALVGGQPSPSMRLLVEEAGPRGVVTAQALVDRLVKTFDVPAEVKFSTQLPVRWKGVKVLKEADIWERLP